MLKMTKKLCKLQLLKRCEFYEKSNISFKNIDFTLSKSAQENIEKFIRSEIIAKPREKTENHLNLKSF